jgi:diguanylate cyclase (GGDEF)-like protein/PAS domain S-box-containing protein
MASDSPSREARKRVDSTFDRFALHSTELRADLDRLTRIAARLVGTTLSGLSLLAGDKVLVKGMAGAELAEVDAGQSFCPHTVREPVALVVPDASCDERFAHIEQVRGYPGLRFYAGVPLISTEGHAIGALSVAGLEPRPEGLGDEDIATLRDLAGLVIRALEGARAQSRWQDYLQVATDWIWEQDADFRFTFFSAEVESKVNMQISEMIGRTRWDFAGVDPDQDPFWGAHKATLEARLPFKDFRYTRARGDFAVTMSVSGKPIFGGDGTFLGYRGIGRDVTAEEVARRRIEHLATRDHLTGLANRGAFEAAVADAIAACETGYPAALFLLDLDRFKEANDSLGHSAGDDILIEVARRLRGLRGGGLLAARIGGDEFALLVPAIVDVTEPDRIAEEIRTIFEAPINLGAHTVHSGASIGAFLIADSAMTPSQVMANADLALYEAKNSGGRSHRFFESTMRAEVEARREVVEEFDGALQRGEIELFYQPQLRLSDKSVAGFEALIRWRHPTRGLLMPGTFIAALEDARLGALAGAFVLETAAAQARAWLDQGLPAVRIGVNLSPAQFRDETFPTTIAEVLARHRLNPRLFEIEVTENILLDEGADIRKMLAALHDLGVSIAFDDFGTGYASLSHLRRFPIQRIKIDREFVRDMDGGGGATIAHAITSLGIALGMQVTAEGIETPEQELLLRLSGCHEVQGWLYSKALPADEAAAYLARSLGLDRPQKAAGVARAG